MPAFLLIHGSWHGAWCWERLTPLLRERGHRVTAIDLPAHGDDRTPHFRASVRSYSRCVQAAAAGLPEKPIAVGHSMGGIAITQAALDAPQLFSALVYLCAFAPVPGESLLHLVRQDPDSRVRANTSLGLDRVRFARERAKAVFYNDCAASDAEWATSRLRPDPLFPLLQRVTGSNGSFPPRGYIACTRDRAISIDHQHAMAERGSFQRIVTMDTDHSPFLSAPRELAEHLHDMASLAA